MPEPDDQGEKRKSGLAYGAGLSLFFSVAGFCTLGWLLDRWLEPDTTGRFLGTIRVNPEDVKGAVAVDGFSVFFTVLICVAIILAALLADGYLRREGLDHAELFVLVLLSASGGVIMASANDLVVVFLALEILSIALYVLAAFDRRRLESQEAGLKYFVLGAFSSAIFLYGIALTYGATGTTSRIFRCISGPASGSAISRRKRRSSGASMSRTIFAPCSRSPSPIGASARRISTRCWRNSASTPPGSESSGPSRAAPIRRGPPRRAGSGGS